MNTALQLYTDTKINKVLDEDRSIHDWYRFVLSFPPHLVRDYFLKFEIDTGQCVLDPFSGTGTTLVEAKKVGIKSIGIEANPIAHMASKAKTYWDIDTDAFLKESYDVAECAEKRCNNNSILKKLPSDADSILIKNSINPIQLHKSILLLESIIEYGRSEYQILYKVAFAKNLVYKHSNLRFGPEVGISRKSNTNYDIVNDWIKQILIMKQDLEIHHKNALIEAHAILDDSRDSNRKIMPKSIDAVICSPPYPNEKDYTRTTRLESVLLGFINNKKELRAYKEALIRSNTRNVFKGDDDDTWIIDNKYIQDLSAKIEDERIRLQKTSGFEKLYHKVVKLYFGGMVRHLERLKYALKNGAKLAYVVGDQSSYFRIPIRTGEVLEALAHDLGYTVIGRDIFRTRFSTATQENLKEEVVILQWKK